MDTTPKYICPFCYRPMPVGREPTTWACCGEVGHAVLYPTCPKCGTEDFDANWLTSERGCLVCGHKADTLTDASSLWTHRYNEQEPLP